MSSRCLSLFPLLLLLAFANTAAADNDRGPRASVNDSAKDLDQIVYKGLVGNALDGVPMDPAKRVSLQRTNAIISNTLSGRSLAVLAGLSNPALLIGGLVWGVWAASNIKPEEDGVRPTSDGSQSGGEIAAQRELVALLDSSPAGRGALARNPAEATLAKPFSAAAADEPPRARAPVLKVWLPQRASGMAAASTAASVGGPKRRVCEAPLRAELCRAPEIIGPLRSRASRPTARRRSGGADNRDP